MSAELAGSAESVDSAQFRDVVGRFATGVTVLTAVADGRAHAMTANAFSSVSLDPLQVLVCVDRHARMHQVIQAATGWAVSILAADQEELSRAFARRADADQRLAVTPTHPAPRSGAPIVDGAIAWLECTTVTAHDGGDHSIYIGEVVGLSVGRPDASPLLYFRGRYGDPAR